MGFDASIRIIEPDSVMDSTPSRLFRVSDKEPFVNVGDARRASMAYAEMLIGGGESDCTIWKSA